MPIDASIPTTVPAQAEQTFPYWWVNSLVIRGHDPANVTVYVVLRKYGLDANGNMVWSPVDPPVEFDIKNVMASTDPNVLAVLSSLITNLQAYGTNQGLL